MKSKYQFWLLAAFVVLITACNYDGEGYPTGAIMTSNAINAVTNKYTYEYSTLDE
jgi:hypothetical protein